MVTEPHRLRALSHRVRLELIGALQLHGQLTATEAGHVTGYSPTTCSFHLRQLAKYGFVEEVQPPSGSGRQRPWKLSHLGLAIRTDAGEVKAGSAAELLLRSTRVRCFSRYERWLAGKTDVDASWRDAASLSEAVLLASEPELQELTNELKAVVTAWHERVTARPSTPDMRPVQLVALAFPVLDD
jgi:predicted ArsR family transcriptional regulator